MSAIQLGISNDTRKNVKSIYDFKTGNVKTKCLHEGWQTGGSVKVVRMAFNLYCNGTPSVLDYDDAEKQVDKLCKGHQFHAEESLWGKCKDIYEQYPHFGKDSGYGIIAGHRRKRGSELVGKTQMIRENKVTFELWIFRSFSISDFT